MKKVEAILVAVIRRRKPTAKMLKYPINVSRENHRERWAVTGADIVDPQIPIPCANSSSKLDVKSFAIQPCRSLHAEMILG